MTRPSVWHTARMWVRWHDLTQHALVPLWRAIPERRRWDVVHALNRSRRTAWCDLVDAAIGNRDPDPCDGILPISSSLYCRTRCGWVDHGTEGHECSCYCGKFGPQGQFPFEVAQVARPSVWHTIGRALGVVAALPARAVGLAIAHRPQLIPILIHARLLLDWQHARKARR